MSEGQPVRLLPRLGRAALPALMGALGALITTLPERHFVADRSVPALVYVPPKQRQRQYLAPKPPVETNPTGRGARRRAERAKRKGGR